MSWKNRYGLLLLLSIGLFTKGKAQDPLRTNIVPKGYQRAQINNGDTIAVNKLVRDVKRTLPYAKMVYETLIETYEYIETLPTEKAKQEHLKRMEKELFAEYKPVLKKLSLSQGKLLIKLIDRECNQSSYNLVKAFLGSFRAGFWNLFAGLFGASLKTEYDPYGKDALTEQVVILVENGLI